MENGSKILSSAEIENIANNVKKFSELVNSAVTYSSNVINKTIGEQIIESYEQASAKNKQNIEDLRSIVQVLSTYDQLKDVMVQETQEELEKQRQYTEGQNV